MSDFNPGDIVKCSLTGRKLRVLRYADKDDGNFEGEIIGTNDSSPWWDKAMFKKEKPQVKHIVFEIEYSTAEEKTEIIEYIHQKYLPTPGPDTGRPRISAVQFTPLDEDDEKEIITEITEHGIQTRTIAQALHQAQARAMNQACRICGCTHWNPCDPPCAWAEPDLCTTCKENET